MELEVNATKAEQRIVNLHETSKGQNESAAKLTANVHNAYFKNA